MGDTVCVIIILLGCCQQVTMVRVVVMFMPII